MNAVTANFDGVENLSIEPKSLAVQYNTIQYVGLISLFAIFGIPLVILAGGFGTRIAAYIPQISHFITDYDAVWFPKRIHDSDHPACKLPSTININKWKNQKKAEEIIKKYNISSPRGKGAPIHAIRAFWCRSGIR